MLEPFGKAAVTLRAYRESDRADLGSLVADPVVMRYVGNGQPIDPGTQPHLLDRVFEKYRSDPSFRVWAIDVNGEFAGHAELKRRSGRSEYEIVYVLQQRRWGRGTGASVAATLVDEARAMGLPFVVATVHESNVASIAILRGLGFVRDERLSVELETTALVLRLDEPPRRRIAGEDASDQAR